MLDNPLATKWYYQDGNSTKGPLTGRELEAAIKEGRIQPFALVTDDCLHWQSAEKAIGQPFGPRSWDDKKSNKHVIRTKATDKCPCGSGRTVGGCCGRGIPNAVFTVDDDFRIEPGRLFTILIVDEVLDIVVTGFAADLPTGPAIAFLSIRDAIVYGAKRRETMEMLGEWEPNWRMGASLLPEEMEGRCVILDMNGDYVRIEEVN